ncbi:hypothetical protein B0H66DRAFT_166523 [Apodospora peruviana]|uniref:Rhodopsin domain-containing protein n=1 Tax=Apodospora peruviana TaxID=516989 RepID=A0AAE0ILN5_9PEZI|nr:hypothetical protein B0H66DRAFT_166523 [Apodospora peruviana]
MSGVGQTAPPDGDVNKGPMVLALTIVSTILALVAVGMRLFARITVVRNVGWDDYTIVGAAAMAIVNLAFEIISVQNGNGRHMFYLEEHNLVEASKWSRATVPPNLTASMLARISCCLFMMRIVERFRHYKIFLWTIIVLTFLSTNMVIINLLASCRPLEKLWNPKVEGKCFPGHVSVIVGLIQASIAIAADWLVALFPILILRNLRMAMRTKIALAVLMGLGVFIGISALVKTLQLYTLGKRIDVTWDTLSLTIWSIIEQNVSIIAVSVPGIRPLFSRYFSVGGSSGGGQTPQLYFSCDLSNMNGRKKGPSFPTATSMVSAAGGHHANKHHQPPSTSKHIEDDYTNGSESSLVRGSPGPGNMNGITKTVSVSLHSHKSEPGLAF